MKRQNKKRKPNFGEESKTLLQSEIILSQPLQSSTREPSNIKFSRRYEINRVERQLSLFSEIEGKQQYTLTIGKKELGISLLSIQRVDFALREILFRQSIIGGTQEKNTGLAKDGTTLDGQIITPSNINGEIVYIGEIQVELGEIAFLAFGSKDNKIKKLTEKVLEAFQEGIVAQSTYGDEKRRSLLWLRGHDYNAKTKAKILDIILNPIYTMGIESYYSYEPGVLTKLGNITKAKMNLLYELGKAHTSAPFTIYRSELLSRLEMESDYKKNPDRTLKSLREALEAFVSLGKLLEYPKEEQRGKDVLLTIKINPKYPTGKANPTYVKNVLSKRKGRRKRISNSNP